MFVQPHKHSQPPLALRAPPVSIFTRTSSRSASLGASTVPSTQSTVYTITIRSSKSKFLDNFNCLFDVERHRYHTSSVSQDPNSGEIEIKAEKHSDGRITSGKVETKNVWTTASDLAVKNRGYVEVRATMPAKVGRSSRTPSLIYLYSGEWRQVGGSLASNLAAWLPASHLASLRGARHC